MYATYKIDVNDITFKHYKESKDFLNLQRSDLSLLESVFLNINTVEEIINAEDILSSWFPLRNKQVFISHSHKDEYEALNLAAWLYDNFNIECFIDSQVWRYSNDLQKMIDNEYCRNYGSSTYNYEKRNISTSHVHMLLNSAIQNMIDNCECIIFIKSSNSVKPLTSLEQGDATHSPWINAEILSTKLLRRRKPEDHLGRPKPTFESIAKDSVNKILTIEYPLNLSNLISLDQSILERWKSNFLSNNIFESDKRFQALDYLYKLTSIPVIKANSISR